MRAACGPAADGPRRRSPSDARDAVTLHFDYALPYDWRAMVQFFAPRAIPGVEYVEEARYLRSIALGDAHGFVDIRPAPGGEPCLHASIVFPRPQALDVIVARIRRVFDLDADAAAIDARLARDALLAPLVATRPGVRVTGGWSDFELAVRAVLGQQITLAGARRLASDLVATFGAPLDAGLTAATGGTLTRVFPEPAGLAGADVAAALAMPRTRAQTIGTLAGALVDEPRLFEAGPSLSERIARLSELRGIGDWSANYIAMRAMGESDAFPASDVVLQRAVARLTGERPTPQALLARAERWRPWRAYAAVRLWSNESDARARAGGAG